MGEGERLEIFGYGSLVWKHDFNFAVKENGYIKGYQRKFWQQNKTHRGTPDQVTLIGGNYQGGSYRTNPRSLHVLSIN